ncbi:hypothetical protein [Lyngbya confervoides]|uniref:Uncharacterized protein n=1 Tax=Lyngbya confervoides BDU141951 TaxID=1574623 RepID=A0ABD4T1Z4_9CYAN|nr:hypothetical protein [Lyngbya confervoides]MCM1982625.1 hypothetical protein [Lyngbya confervoides BDU141951]
MVLRQFPVWIGLGLGFASLWHPAQPALGQGQSASQPITTQCLHPLRGESHCQVHRFPLGNGLQIQWPDGSLTEIRLDSPQAQLRDGLNADWQGIDAAGLCWQDQCFQASRQALTLLQRGKAPIAAQCYHPLNGTTACQVQVPASTFQYHIDRGYGEPVRLSGKPRYQIAGLPNLSLAPAPSLGFCANGICVFSLQ